MDLLKKINAFSVLNTLKPQKEDITVLLKHFNKKDVEISTIEMQWRKIHLIEWQKHATTAEFWCEVLNYKDSEGIIVFEELAMFALSLLKLPHSNAEVERLFSKMNVIKTKLRNRMNLETLNAILTIRAGLKRHGKCCADFTLSPDSTMVAKIKTLETYVSEDDEDFDIFV